MAPVVAHLSHSLDPRCVPLFCVPHGVAFGVVCVTRFGVNARTATGDLSHVGDLPQTSTVKPQQGLTHELSSGSKSGASVRLLDDAATVATLPVAGKLPEGVRRDEGENNEDRRGIGYFMTKHMMSETIEQLRVRACPPPEQGARAPPVTGE